MTSTDDLTDAELRDISVGMKKPIIFNYFVGPHVPPGADTLLSIAGEPFMLNYNEIDWKKLAQKFQSDLLAAGFPSSIKVYIGNDAIDLFDINGICTRLGGEADNYDPIGRADQCYSHARISNFRAGVASIPQTKMGLHLNDSPTGLRPPIAALFISIRFANMSQVIDYLASTTEAVIGLPDYPRSDRAPDKVRGDCIMSPVLADWLRDDVGAVYGDKCTVVGLPTTLSGVQG